MKRIILLFFLLVDANGLFLTGQQVEGLRMDAVYRSAEALYNLDEPDPESDDVALKLFLAVAGVKNGISSDLRIKSLLKAADIHRKYNRFQASNELCYRALAENQKANVKPAYNYEAWLNLGNSMYLNGTPDSARYFFELATEIAKNNRDQYSLPQLDKLYNSLGVIYYEAANFLQAQNHFETALNFSVPGNDDDFYRSIQSNIANCLLKQHYYDSSIRLLSSLEPLVEQKWHIRQQLAHAYVEKGVYDSALNIYQSLELPHGLTRVAAFNDLGRIYMQKGDWLRAEITFDSAIAESKAVKGKLKNKEEALSYLYRSELASNLGLLDEALTWINLALREVHLDFMPKSRYDNPEVIANTVSPITFHRILFAKANLIYKKYRREKKADLLTEALKTYRLAIETSRYIFNNFDNDDAKIFFIEDSRPLYDAAISVAYEASLVDKKNIESFSYIIESYKGNILFQNMVQSGKRIYTKVPGSLLERESKLKQIYAAYLSKLNQVTGEEETLRIRKRLLSLQVEMSRLQKSFEEYETEGWKINGPLDSELSLREVQKKLNKETALLNYFVSGNHIYLLCITYNAAKVHKIHADKIFLKYYNTLLEQTYTITDGLRYEGNISAKRLYDYLVKPAESLIKGRSRLVIIPDEYLYYLPFDALIQSPVRSDFLMYHYAISYHYSFSLLFREIYAGHDKIRKDSILAFAPFAPLTAEARTNRDVSVLPYSAEEIQQPNAREYAADFATKKKFLREYSGFRFIHLATHASLGADSSNNWIRFFPGSGAVDSGKLYIHEVYNLNMHGTELVTLSACETGGGVTMSGEGLISLSRAFIYAGAKGIVSTLYKTDDLVTAFIMKRMYYHMANGDDVPEALRKSKVDLLESEEISSRLKSPNYWVNFVYIGKVSNRHSFSYQGIFIGLALITALIPGFMLYRKLKSAAPS
jgi:CHAT domain-containing protein